MKTCLEDFAATYDLIQPIFNTIIYVLNIIGQLITLGADAFSGIVSLF